MTITRHEDCMIEGCARLPSGINSNPDATRFLIGDYYQTRGKHPQVCRIIDIHRTFNSAGEIIKVRYVAQHKFMGQTITNSDVCDTTVAMGYIGPALPEDKAFAHHDRGDEIYAGCRHDRQHWHGRALVCEDCGNRLNA